MSGPRSALAGPWLHKVPTDWGSTQIRRVARFRNGADYKPVEVASGGYPVYGSGGEFRRSSEYLHDGTSVLFGRKGTVDRPLLVHGRFWTVDTMFFTEIGPQVEPRYFHYYATTMPFDYYRTSTALPSMTQEDLSSHVMPLPPLDTQRAIADYLDRETTQIDTLIAKQEQLISRFQERRDAGWAWALTSVADSAPSTTLRRMIVSIADGPFGSSLTSAHYSDSGARVIRLGNVGINEFKNEDQAFVPIEYFRELLAHEARAGDVIIAGLGDDQAPLGRAAVLPEVGPAIVKADCYRVRPRPEVDSAYLAWALSTPQLRHQFSLLARGATRARLNTAVVQQAVIPLPPLDEQRRIVAYLDEQTAKIDTLIAKAQRFIELAKERREALITAAVTGQLDVTAA